MYNIVYYIVSLLALFYISINTYINLLQKYVNGEYVQRKRGKM